MTHKNEIKCEITWLGQAGFLIQTDKVRLVVDPYLSDSLSEKGIERLFSVPVAISELNPDIVCFTHDHADHFDEQTILPLIAMYPSCRFIGPTSVYEHYCRLNLNPAAFTILDCEDVHAEDTLHVHAVTAYHTDKYAIGLVIKLANRCIYISGDTLLENGLLESVLKTVDCQIDVVLICINGKLGNMNAHDAVKVVGQLKPKIAIPMHYGLFADNTVDPTVFVESVARLGIKCVTMEPGKPMQF
ncbi:MBL fold metallo-hydrolase [Pedobacter nyackensis]|uniref:L-ascorbate metabolism protein UlaG, beta-lactamase superfamily n=1 Tax=Pedobacter nyackensis TaxID=475255 RepID=A0A1W2AAU3_9SPHI|nr:MBL fold metallo-hydrolase [Pedobacter nyackensis]SMC57764.1 L-ascorbate metabolism protein UlaG, beta-lactamase superfamily [Pedobacter nyackensis]